MSTPHLPRPSGRPRPRRLVALLATPALVASLLTLGHSPAVANPPAAGATGLDAAPELLPGGVQPVPVTLITGDTVLWSDTGDGNPQVDIKPAPRDYSVEFDQSGTQKDFYVIPTDAMPQVASGTLDMELFNIPGLIRQGLDDQATGGELPVIVTFDRDRTPQQLKHDADALPATADPVGVAGIGGAGVSIDRDHAAKFRDAVLTAGSQSGRGPSTASQDLGAGVESVRLDRVYEIDLDESVPQIGAPQAWEAGYTGEGVTVAVLDTGVDTGHPDLAGQVVAAKNFTDEPATDNHGHGTHVASTIAGTGAASDGQYTGVAPDADLVSGKVCDRDGQCRTSWIMAGMQWAATVQDADVVNMSLGGGPSDGTDPLSQLVNDLSEQTGALFVVSAGNSECGGRVVSSPAAADAALAVGAVDKSDRLADFSSCGPRLGDHAVKPEITAPGVGIVAARSATGTDMQGNAIPVGEHYLQANGTSMASPHVAGAAALLAQAKPDLGWSELKDTLVSTAADGGYLWLEQGTGRVKVPATVNSPVYAQGTVNFGVLKGQAEQDITYTNHSDSDITLTLAASVTDRNGRAADAASLSLSADTVTVPAHGSASVTVVAAVDASDPNLSGQESFGGVVTATGPGVDLRTGVGFGPRQHRVTIEALDSNGNRIGTDTAPDRRVFVTYDTLDENAVGRPNYHFFTSDGIAIGYIPTGTFTFIVNTLRLDPSTGQYLRSNVLTEVEVDIDSDTTVTLDAREAVPVQVSVPLEVDKRNHSVALIREMGSAGLTFTERAGGGAGQVYVTPAPAGELAFLALNVNWVMAQPQPLRPLPWMTSDDCFGSPTQYAQPDYCYSETPAYIYHLPFAYENGIPDDLHEKVTRADVVEVPTQYHSEHPDAFIMQQFNSGPPFACACGGGTSHRVWFRPGEVTEYMLADDRITWSGGASLVRRSAEETQTGIALYSSDRFLDAEAGARRDEEDWFEAPLRIGAVDVREEFFGNPDEVAREAVAARGGVDGNTFVAPYYIVSADRGQSGICRTSCASWRMWNLDTGTELDRTWAGRGWGFGLSPEPATYRVEQVEEYPANTAPVFRTGRATTEWTFTSRLSDAPVPDGYKCGTRLNPNPPFEPWEKVCQIQPLIQLEYDLDLDLGNRAKAGRAHVFTITAGHHSKAIDRAAVTDLTVEASFDDGQTWTNARVVGKAKHTWDTGGFLPAAEPYQQFRVVLKVPPMHRTNGYVTLRVQAQDANGGTVEQTINRTYILK